MGKKFLKYSNYILLLFSIVMLVVCLLGSLGIINRQPTLFHYGSFAFYALFAVVQIYLNRKENGKK